MEIKNRAFYYQDTAEPIVDSIISLFSKGIKSFESYEEWNYEVPISDKTDDYQHFNWRFSVCRSSSVEWDPESGYDLIGLAGRDYLDEPSIEISIALPKGRHQKNIIISRPELFDVVSHEIHHLAQNMENNIVSNKANEKGRLSYFLDPYEVEAFHVGFRAHSVLTGIPFKEIAKNYIHKAWPEGSDQEIQRVVTAWKNTEFPVFFKNLNRSE